MKRKIIPLRPEDLVLKVAALHCPSSHSLAACTLVSRCTQCGGQGNANEAGCIANRHKQAIVSRASDAVTLHGINGD